MNTKPSVKAGLRWLMRLVGVGSQPYLLVGLYNSKGWSLRAETDARGEYMVAVRSTAVVSVDV